MSMISDGDLGIAAETTYGTPVTVARFLEFLASSKVNFDPQRKQGMGLRVGSKVARSGRRVTPTFQWNGNLDVELCSKGMGLLWQAALGDSTSTVVSAPLYQQVHTLESSALQPALTVQYVPIDATGAANPLTLTGVTIPSFEINVGQGEIPTASFALDGQTASTATALATPSYAASSNLFHFAQGTITVGGLITAPTSTALASSAGTVAGNVRSINFKVDSKTDTNRQVIGMAGKKRQPTVGQREISGAMVVEYDSNTLRDAYLNDTELSILLQFDTGVTVGTGTEKLQIVLPAIKLDGEVPQINGTDLITQSIPFTGLDNLVAAQPLWIVQTTADTAL